MTQRTYDPSDFFTYRGVLKVKKLAEIIERQGHIKVGVDRLLYRYEDGVYRPDGEVFARARTRSLLDYRFRKSRPEEVLSWLRSAFPSIGMEPTIERINVKNGLLRWESGRLYSHRPNVLSVNQIPVAWNRQATCDVIDKFMKEVLPDDAIDFIYEIIGYALYAGNPMRKSVLLLGPGRNGKSCLLSVMTELLGSRNVSTVPLQVLSENRFAASELFGKLANICGDLDARAIRNTDIFKMVTGGDQILAERKYKDHFTYRPYALPIFSANEAPTSADQTQGWFDRWLIVPMENRILADREDPFLTKKLIAQDQLEGLLVKAVKGLRRLMKRGRFELPQSVLNAGQAYREHVDTVETFLNEECSFKIDGWTARSRLFARYRDWVSRTGRIPVTPRAFNERVRSAYSDSIVERGRNGIQGWRGIQVSDGR